MRETSQSYYSILKFAWGEEPVNYKVHVDLVFQKGSESTKNSLSYDLRMQVIGFQNENPVIRIDKKNQILNHKKPDTIIDEITLETAEAINTLELGLNARGRIKSVLNFVDITNNWEIIKNKTMERYPGESIEGFLGILEKSLETPEKLVLAFKRDPMFYNFFSGIYCNYGIAQKVNDTFISGNLVPDIDLHYTSEKRWIDLPDKNVEITETGELQAELIDKEQLIKAINTRTKLNIISYSELGGMAELKSNVSTETGRIYSHKSTLSITVDDLKIENSIKVTEK